MPKAIQRILVGLDGSELAEIALPHAVAMARAFDTELVLVRVLESKGRAGQPVDAVAWRLARAEAQTYLRAHAARLTERGLSVRTVLREGDAASELLGFMEHDEIGLLVIGSHGVGGATAFALCGTVQKVLAGAGRSVLLVRCVDGKSSATGDGPIYRRVLAAVDGSQRAEWALCLAATVARSQGAELVVLSVAPIPEMVRRPPLGARVQRQVDELAALNRRWAEEYVAAMKTRLAAPDLEVRTVVCSSSRIRHELDLQLREAAPDLVVVSAHGAGGSAPWPFGSVSHHLLHHGSAPLLVFQDQKACPFASEATELAADDSRSPRRGR
jgi:nucleotide-binding universal stress UspA family protein